MSECALAAIGFNDRYLQVTVGATGVDIANLKSAWRHGSGVDDVAVLAYFNSGVRFGNAVHHRCVTRQVIRQHANVRAQLNTAKAAAFEHIAVGIKLPNGKTAFEQSDIVFQIGAVAGETTLCPRALAQG